jgi:lipase
VRNSAPELKNVRVDGVDLALWDWPGEGPTLFFVHATGFHGRSWDQVIRHFPGRRCLAVDLRGHGRSGKPDPPYHWQVFSRDMARLVEVFDLRGAIGIGHSMGGHTIVEAAALRPETFASLVLIDPTIFPLEWYGQPALDSSFIARRRNVWSSPEEMFERFRTRPPFVKWKPEVLKDYCDFGLLPEGDHFVLACPPAIEHSIYSHSTEAPANLHPVIPAIEQPVVVVRGGIPWTSAEFNLNASPTDPALASRFPHGRDVLLEGRSHYIPMESPELVAGFVNDSRGGTGVS